MLNRIFSESTKLCVATFHVLIFNVWQPGCDGMNPKPNLKKLCTFLMPSVVAFDHWFSYPIGQQLFAAFTANTSKCNFGQPWMPRQAKWQSIGCANVHSGISSSFRRHVAVCPSAAPSTCFQLAPEHRIRIKIWWLMRLVTGIWFPNCYHIVCSTCKTNSVLRNWYRAIFVRLYAIQP